MVFVFPVVAQDQFEKDVINTSAEDIEITFIGHGTLMLTHGQLVIHIDPWSHLVDYSKLPEADIILITHHHGDHLDPGAIQKIRTENTIVLLTELCVEQLNDGIIMRNGDVDTFKGIEVHAVPSYNLVNKRESGEFFHPKGEGNGYIMDIADKRIYIAGDTENTPEMKALEHIDIAFLPMNLPYTMTPEMVADAVNAFSPKILYPYHYGETDTSDIVELLKENTDVEIRIRKMK